MPRKDIVPTTEQHIIELSETARFEDKREVWAAAHVTVEQALRHGVALSEEPFTGIDDGRVVCIFGVATPTLITSKGSPWMLASDLLFDNVRTFARISKIYVDEVIKRYDYLENYVDCRNVKAVRWLAWLGFEIHPAAPYGAEQLLFNRFTMEK